MGHSMGSVTALHMAANTDICQSAVFFNGVGLTPHRSVQKSVALCNFFYSFLNILDSKLHCV